MSELSREGSETPPWTLGHASLLTAIITTGTAVAWLYLAETWRSASWLGFLGAMGWIVSLTIRLPIVAAVAKDPDRAARVGAVISGPAEEAVRLGVVLAFASTPRDAALIGLGSATVEVLQVSAASFAWAAIVFARREGENRPDRHSPKAKVVWDVGSDALERAVAGILHIGFASTLYRYPPAVILTAAAHSAVNVSSIRIAEAGLRNYRAWLIAVGSGLLLLLWAIL